MGSDAGAKVMEQKSIGPLIINSPYEEPARHWSYNRERRTFSSGRRDVVLLDMSLHRISSQSFDDPGQFVEIPLVNQIRARVRAVA